MRLFALAASLTLVASITPASGQNRALDFELLNRTGLTIAELYVSPTKDNEWGEDILGRDVLATGETAEVSFSPRETDCTWDMKIVDEDDDEVVWTSLDLCKASHITLRYENGRPTALIK